MRDQPVDIPFPFSGLNEFPAYDDQAQGTSVDMQNVVPVDPRSGRLRGAQRPGIEKFNDSEVAGTAAVQDLIHITAPRFGDTSAQGAGQQLVNQPSGAAWGLLDSGGNRYVTGGNSSDQFQLACFDSFSNVYIATKASTTSLEINIDKYDKDGKFVGFLSESTTLSGDVTATQEFVRIESDVFPAAPFAIRVASPSRSTDEWMWVTAKSTSAGPGSSINLTVLRGDDIPDSHLTGRTSAEVRSHSSGTTVYLADRINIKYTTTALGSDVAVAGIRATGASLFVLVNGDIDSADLSAYSSKSALFRFNTSSGKSTEGSFNTGSGLAAQNQPKVLASPNNQSAVGSLIVTASQVLGDNNRKHRINGLVIADGAVSWLASDVDDTGSSTTRRLLINSIDPTTGLNVRSTTGVTTQIDAVTDSTTVTASTKYQFPEWVANGDTINVGLSSHVVDSINTDYTEVTLNSAATISAGEVVVKHTGGDAAVQAGLHLKFNSTIDSLAGVEGDQLANHSYSLYDMVEGGDAIFASVQRLNKDSSSEERLYENHIYSIKPRPRADATANKNPVVNGIDPSETVSSGNTLAGRNVLIKKDDTKVSLQINGDPSGSTVTVVADTIPAWVHFNAKLYNSSRQEEAIVSSVDGNDITVTNSTHISSWADTDSLIIPKNICPARSLAYDAASGHLAMVGRNPMGVGDDGNSSTVYSLAAYDVGTKPALTTVDTDLVHRSQPSQNQSLTATVQWDRIEASARKKNYQLSRNTTPANIPGDNEFVSVEIETDDLNSDDLTYNWAYNADDTDQDFSLDVNTIGQDVADINRPRDVRLIAVAGGLVKTIDSSGVISEVAGQETGPLLSTVRPQLFSAIGYPNVYFADKGTARYYDTESGEMKDWEAEVGSENPIPKSTSGDFCRLIASWGGRIVLSGLETEPQAWFMSKIDNPNNFDYSEGFEDSAVAGSTITVSSSTSPAGRTPDIVNALVPWTNDILLFGMDHTIAVLSGNPAAGGRFDVISDVTGMAFGRPYAFHPDRSLWFIGSRGGLYRMASPNAVPERISQTTIDERLASLPLDSTIITMAWDDRLQGFLIFLTSVEGGSDDQHYFYDTRTQGFFPWKFANTSHSPAVIHAFDGDKPDDRTILMGCPDGFIRNLDYDGPSDDGTAISSHVMIGPIKGEAIPLVMTGLTSVLGAGSSNVTYSIHPGDSAEEASSAASIGGGTFTSGRNTWDRRRTSGAAIFIKLSNATLGETWAIERLTATLRTTSRTFEKAH